MRILVLGAGFGGLELTTRLAEESIGDIEVVLIDQADGFVFGFSKLEVMLRGAAADAVWHSYRDLLKRGVGFVQTSVRAIDPDACRVETDAGSFGADVLVVALGADVDARPHQGSSEAATSSTRWPARSRRTTRSSTSAAAP